MPRVVFSRVVWAGRVRTFVLALVMGVAVLAASLLVLAVATRSAEATFSGGNGLIVFSSERDRNAQDIFTINPIDGTTDRLTTFTTGHSGDPAVSPDGSRIAFSRDGQEIWVMNAVGMNANGTGATQITDPSTPKTQPTWSPDGTRIAFVRSGEIYTINADGTDETNLTNSTFTDSRPAWSPDGSMIAFVSRRTGDANSNIYLMDTDPMTNDATNLTQDSTTADFQDHYQGHDDFPSWSPNGTRIAYTNNGTGEPDLYKMDTNPATNDWKSLTDPQPDANDPTDEEGEADPAWSPNGKSIVYVVDANIYVKDATVVGPGEPLDTDPGNDISPDWQPDPPTCDIRGTNGDDNGVANDALNGTSADEVICGRGGNDVINGGGGNDILMGEGGNDTLIAPSGRATLNGGTGKDTASFAGARRPVGASLVSGFALRLGTDPLEGVAMVDVENLTGTSRNDVLEGSNAVNKLVAGDGADKLFGLGGNDRLDSRDGVSSNDRVDGGADTDTCTTDSGDVAMNCE